MKSLPAEKSEFLRILATRIVPETSDLDDAGLDRFFEIIDGALLDRPETVRGQFATFLGVLKWAPAVRFGRPFDRLPGEHQDAVLRWFEDCPVSILRKGFWGLKAMIFMGYYGQPETNEIVGYAPELDGRARFHA